MESMEEAKRSIRGKSAVMINASEWTVYTHMRIHQSLDSTVLTPPLIVSREEETLQFQRGFPDHLLPTSGDVYQYIRGNGDMIEDVKKRDWEEEEGKGTSKYLVVCSHERKGWRSFRQYKKQVEEYLGNDIQFHSGNTLFLGGRHAGSGDFPQDVPEHMVFDVIWFAGCNFVSFLGFEEESTIRRLQSMSHTDTRIVFTERSGRMKNYINDIGPDGIPPQFLAYKDTGGLMPIEVLGYGRFEPDELVNVRESANIMKEALELPSGAMHYLVRGAIGLTPRLEKPGIIKIRKRFLDWLTASLACARPKSPYSIPTIYNVSERPLFMLENGVDIKDEGTYRRSVSWNIFTSESSMVFASTIASWGEISPDPTIDIYWVPLEGGEEDLLEEMRFSARNQLLLEGDISESLIEDHRFDWDVYLLIACIFSAESTGENYTSEDVKNILHLYEENRGGFDMVRAILHRNAPLIDLWEDKTSKNPQVEFTLIPPLEYYGLFMG